MQRGLMAVLSGQSVCSVRLNYAPAKSNHSISKLKPAVVSISVCGHWLSSMMVGLVLLPPYQDEYFIYVLRIVSWNLVDCHTLQVPIPMATQNQPLGVCPFCGSTLDAGSILIRYESDGTERVFAECYTCDEPVHPK